MEKKRSPADTYVRRVSRLLGMIYFREWKLENITSLPDNQVRYLKGEISALRWAVIIVSEGKEDWHDTACNVADRRWEKTLLHLEEKHGLR